MNFRNILSGFMPQQNQPQAPGVPPRVDPSGGKRVPKRSWQDKAYIIGAGLQDMGGGEGNLDAASAMFGKRDQQALMAGQLEEEDAIARQVFKDDQRGYLAWRANREETGKALATGLEDYTASAGSVRGRGDKVLLRVPFAPQVLSAGQQMRGGDGQLIASAPFKPEVVTRSPGEAIDVIDPNSTNDIFAALIQQESGGRGDAVGPQTPYGRALGSTQMLPETAKGMADKLGLPWQPELMTQTTPQAMQYQQTLGRAYFDEGLQRYGGDPEKALKYYHGGPDERLWGPKTEAYAAAVLERMGPRSQTVSQATPKPGFRPATAQEKAAYGIPADQAAQISPDGRVDIVGERLKPVPIPVVQALTGNNAALGTIDRALEDIQAYPGAVGMANYLPDPQSKRFHERLAMMAMHCGHWSLARRALQSGLQRDGANPTDLAQLAWCDARTGRLRKAADTVSAALALDPASVLAQEVMQRIEQRLAGWEGVWRQPIEHAELPMVLEPLDASHAEAMLYQYRDPQIAIMTGLPAMTTLESMQQWIDEQLRESALAHFAIMHRDLGFVGYINLAISDHAAFFCFWTGVDFQGRGLATQAGKLVCDYARSFGVPVLLTSAYTDNQRSITALKRIGFTEIPIRALPPDHERIFYAFTPEAAPEMDFVAELRDYYCREKISLSFPDAKIYHSNQILDENL
jgi:RimJ/RimL family protein N-acetyltransferase/soluble lytic murein transglycosylase-like protein